LLAEDAFIHSISKNPCTGCVDKHSSVESSLVILEFPGRKPANFHSNFFPRISFAAAKGGFHGTTDEIQIDPIDD